MQNFPVDGDEIVRIATTRAHGINDCELSRAAARGELVRVAPGAYVHPSGQRAQELHRLRVLAEQTSPTSVISHSSAAVMHGLEMLSPDLSRLHITARSATNGYRRKRRHLHPGALYEEDVILVDGVWVTGLERTAFDIGRSSPAGLAGALAVLDSALRLGGDRARIESLCAAPKTGVGIARKALVHADPLSENPGESWGRAQMILGDLPLPRLQHEIYGSNGDFIARPDYDWCDQDGVTRLVGEFDGIGKYLKYLRAGESPEDAIRREKRREGLLQDLGIVVVRWGWAELVAQRVVPRIAAQLRALGMLTAAA